LRLAAALPALLLSLAGCAGGERQALQQEAELQRLQHRVQVLERRLERLEQDTTAARRVALPPAPLPTAEADALDRTLQELLTERRRLLQRYTPQHPDVRRLEQEIRALQQRRPGAAGAP